MSDAVIVEADAGSSTSWDALSNESGWSACALVMPSVIVAWGLSRAVAERLAQRIADLLGVGGSP